MPIRSTATAALAHWGNRLHRLDAVLSQWRAAADLTAHIALPAWAKSFRRLDALLGQWRAAAGLGVGLLAAGGCNSKPHPAEWPGVSSAVDGERAANEQGAIGGSSVVAEDGSAHLNLGSDRAAAQRKLAPARDRQWIDPVQLARLVTTTDQPYESQGHEPPRYLIWVEISPEAAELYRTLQPGSIFPNGTWLVARHIHRPATKATDHSPLVHGPIYFMTKGSQGWSYGAASEEGLNIPVIGGVCQDCHTQARADSVFGLPTSRRPTEITPKASVR